MTLDKNKKIILGLVAVCVVVVIFTYWMKNRKDDFKLITDEAEMSRFVATHTQEELDNYRLKVDELKAGDTFGGKTPEETLQMFIDALKAGDMELASKYFVLENQEKILSQLNIGLENNNLDKLIEILERDKIGGYFDGDNSRFQFEIVGTEGEWSGVVEFTFNFIKIKNSEIWKMENI